MGTQAWLHPLGTALQRLSPLDTLASTVLKQRGARLPHLLRPLGLEPATIRHLLSNLIPQVVGSSAFLVLLGGPFKSQGLELASGMPAASGAEPCTRRQCTIIIQLPRSPPAALSSSLVPPGKWQHWDAWMKGDRCLFKAGPSRSQNGRCVQLAGSPQHCPTAGTSSPALSSAEREQGTSATWQSWGGSHLSPLPPSSTPFSTRGCDDLPKGPKRQGSGEPMGGQGLWSGPPRGQEGLNAPTADLVRGGISVRSQTSDLEPTAHISYTRGCGIHSPKGPTPHSG